MRSTKKNTQKNFFGCGENRTQSTALRDERWLLLYHRAIGTNARSCTNAAYGLSYRWFPSALMRAHGTLWNVPGMVPPSKRGEVKQDALKRLHLSWMVHCSRHAPKCTSIQVQSHVVCHLLSWMAFPCRLLSERDGSKTALSSQGR